MHSLIGTFVSITIALSFLSAFMETFPFFTTALIIFTIVRLIKKHQDKNKVRNNRQKINNNDSKILENLRSYFRKDARLYFNDETYITPGNPDNITFDTLEIYMRDEFVSTMADYKLAFPNSYSTFLSMIGDYVKRAKFTRNVNTSKPVTNKAEEPAAAKKESINIKGAQFYIDAFTKLNEQIKEEHITDDLNETVMYLSQIKKIEETFPVSKEKTNKLYQYYLPMLTDILENYKRLSINATLHKEFKENEDRLIKTLVLINSALASLTQSLCDEYYIEMSADMKTLEALLKKDGLASDDLTFESLSKEKNKKVTGNG